MFATHKDNASMAIKFSSDLFLVDRAVRLCEGFLADYDVLDTSAFSLVLRELVNNAVVHGNRNELARCVLCRVSHLGGSQFSITVEDEGAGMDYTALDLSLPDDPRHVQDRGFTLINAFSDQLEFNARGNCVTAYVTVERAETPAEATRLWPEATTHVGMMGRLAPQTVQGAMRS